MRTLVACLVLSTTSACTMIWSLDDHRTLGYELSAGDGGTSGDADILVILDGDAYDSSSDRANIDDADATPESGDGLYTWQQIEAACGRPDCRYLGGKAGFAKCGTEICNVTTSSWSCSRVDTPIDGGGGVGVDCLKTAAKVDADLEEVLLCDDGGSAGLSGCYMAFDAGRIYYCCY